MEYQKVLNGEFKTIKDFDGCLENLRYLSEMDKQTIERLRKENEKLRDEKFKDETIRDLQSQINDLTNRLNRAFEISENNSKKINNWMRTHIKQKHWNHFTDSPISTGAIGGKFTYKFFPTSIATFGEVVCSCGAKIDFEEN